MKSSQKFCPKEELLKTTYTILKENDMTRKQAAMFLLSFLIVAFMATSVVYSAEKPTKPRNQRVSLPARFAPVYGSVGAESGEAAASISKGPGNVALAGSDAYNRSEVVGITTYGYQSTCSMGWQIEHRNTGLIHIDWMRQTNNLLGEAAGGDRRIYYQVYSEADCQRIFDELCPFEEGTARPKR